jgi:hypothetical protein
MNAQDRPFFENVTGVCFAVLLIVAGVIAILK